MTVKSWLAVLAINACFIRCHFVGNDRSADFSYQLSPSIQMDSANIQVLQTLDQFLQSKNEDVRSNPHWIPSNFENYAVSYYDLYRAEFNQENKEVYSPYVLDINRRKDLNSWKIKLAYLAENGEEIPVKFILNLLARDTMGEIKFSSCLHLNSLEWERQELENIQYILSPKRKYSIKQAEKQIEDIQLLNDFFTMSSFPITYYSSKDSKDLYELMGYDYHPYSDRFPTGGKADYGDIIFSGNNSEHYTHEIAHLYIRKKFPNCHRFIEEGLASYLGGSLGYSYEYHKEKLINRMRHDDQLKLENYFDPYLKEYIDGETSIAYFNAALLCEYILDTKGKGKLFDLMSVGRTEEDLHYALHTAGLNPNNYHNTIKSHFVSQKNKLPSGQEQ